MASINRNEKKKKGFFVTIKEIFYLIKENKNNKIRRHFKFGVNYFQNKDYEKAIKEFKKVVGINQNHFSAHVYLARLYSKKGEREKALKEYASEQKINLSRYETHNLKDEYRELINRDKKRGFLFRLPLSAR